MKHHRQRKTLEEVKLDLVRLGITKSQLGIPEVKELTRVLFKDETVKAFVIGFYDGGYGMLVATDLRLIFLDVMVFGRIKVDDIPYSSIGSIELELGIFFGQISIFTRPRNYKFWWLKKDNAYDFNEYVERQMLKHQKEDVQVD
jgi:hypothetical protein